MMETTDPRPPLAEPTDLAARVLDKSDDEWVQRSDGLWIRLTTGLRFHSWEQLTSTFGPLRLADGGDSND